MISVGNDLYGMLSFKKNVLASQYPSPPRRVFIGHAVTATGSIVVGEPASGAQEAVGADMGGVISTGNDFAGALRVVSYRKPGEPIVGGNLSGTVLVGTSQHPANLSGTIVVEDDLPGTVTVTGNVSASGAVVVGMEEQGGELAGAVNIGGTLDGQIAAAGDVTSSGLIDITSDASGVILVNNMYGTIDIGGQLIAPASAPTSGHIEMNGAFDCAPEAGTRRAHRSADFPRHPRSLNPHAPMPSRRPARKPDNTCQHPFTAGVTTCATYGLAPRRAAAGGEVPPNSSQTGPDEIDRDSQ